MKRDVKIVLVGALLIGVAAVSAIKRGERGEAGKCGGGGACCPWMSGLSVWPTNFPAGTSLANTNVALTASEAVTNQQR